MQKFAPYLKAAQSTAARAPMHNDVHTSPWLKYFKLLLQSSATTRLNARSIQKHHRTLSCPNMRDELTHCKIQVSLLTRLCLICPFFFNTLPIFTSKALVLNYPLSPIHTASRTFNINQPPSPGKALPFLFRSARHFLRSPLRIAPSSLFHLQKNQTRFLHNKR